jgi:hypothetical protein
MNKIKNANLRIIDPPVGQARTTDRLLHSSVMA